MLYSVASQSNPSRHIRCIWVDKNWKKEKLTDRSMTASSPEQESLASISSLECVINKLTRQLDAWYSSLPDPIKPELDPQAPCSLVKKWLRSRYWSARHIITRPCLLYAISATNSSLVPTFVIQNSQVCIESCRNFVINAAEALDKQTQYAWNMIQACLSCSLVLTAAARSPALQHLISDLDDILTKVIAIARKWRRPNSSIQFVDWMLSTIQKRQRLYVVP
ncbi:uncharacterized protein N7483_009673 [Penicillium malachiteum]|uniref:uncharacterized protein n=1 Tax=Penicillium malachiteum TaxID=1324776 RepID=UPI0025470D87|nr:uncharacterized protein N7483_009673 [Penicillium malachiteum]KAJ5721739.1 hypothetical protein N7483_009673 [Penicillium malachiteum]